MTGIGQRTYCDLLYPFIPPSFIRRRVLLCKCIELVLVLVFSSCMWVSLRQVSRVSSYGTAQLICSVDCSIDLWVEKGEKALQLISQFRQARHQSPPSEGGGGVKTALTDIWMHTDSPRTNDSSQSIQSFSTVRRSPPDPRSLPYTGISGA